MQQRPPPPTSRSADGALSMAHTIVPSGWLMRRPVSTGISCALSPFWPARKATCVSERHRTSTSALAGMHGPAQPLFSEARAPTGSHYGHNTWRQRLMLSVARSTHKQSRCHALPRPPSVEAGAVATTSIGVPAHMRTSMQPATAPSSVRPRNTPAGMMPFPSARQHWRSYSVGGIALVRVGTPCSSRWWCAIALCHCCA